MRKREHDKTGGFVSVFTALALVVLMGFGALAVDMGYLYYKRGHLQTAADMGALAGANAMISFGENVAAIKEVAVDFARRNLGEGDSPESAVTEADVTFPEPNQIEVTVHRTLDHGNAVQMFLASILDIFERDVNATARAQIVSGNSRCLLPFTIPAKFEWDDACDPKTALNDQLDLKSECEVASVHNVQLYGPEDLGAQIVLKYSSIDSAMAPGLYNPVAAPGGVGGNWYRENIRACQPESQTVSVGDDLLMEPGNMQGPTRQGIQDMLAEDPGAYWDQATMSIRGSRHEDPMNSPRVRPLAIFDPLQPPTSGRTTTVVLQLGAFFVEGVDQHGTVTARFIRAAATGSTSGETSSTLMIAVLVRDSSR